MYRRAAMALVLHMGITAVNADCYTNEAERNDCVAAPCDACAVYNGQKAKIQSVTFVYRTDQDASLAIANFNPLTSDKHQFSGVVLTGGSVNIVCSSKSPDVTFNNVLDGESITINVGSSGAEQACRLTDSNNNVQNLVIHTSCSAPIATNDRWGALVLTAFTGSNTGVCSPPCQACCDTAPAVTPVTNADVYSAGSANDCELVPFGGGKMQLKASSPAYAALRAFVMTGAGTGGSCATTNVAGDTELRVRYVDQSGDNQFRRPSDEVVAYLMNEMCGARTDFTEPFCPDIELRFFCKETCTPNDGVDFESLVRIGSSRFHLGYQQQSECAQAEYASCDVCWTSGSKTKPTSITLRYTEGAPLSLNIQGSNQPTKHFIVNPSQVLQGSLQQVQCDSGSVSWTANEVTISSLSKAAVQCTYTSSGGQTQTIEIHVSCSASLDIGDRYASFTLTSFTNANGGSNTQCPVRPAPPCELCAPPVCDSSPVATTTATEKVYTDHTGFECVENNGVKSIVAGPIKQAFNAWFTGRAGAVCESTNTQFPGAGVGTWGRYTDPETDVTRTVLLAEAEDLMCRNALYCPELKIEFLCREQCNATVANSFTRTIPLGHSTFNIGYESPSECPGGAPGLPLECDVCFPNGGSTKVKPSTLVFRYEPNQAVSTTIQGTNKPEKHIVTGSQLTGSTVTVLSCNNGASGSVSGNVVTVSNIDSSSVTCILQSNGAQQSVNVHTSCSASLEIGDRFGALFLTGFSSSYNGPNSCGFAPPGPPPPCPICFNPCVNMPIVTPPVDTNFPKTAVCATSGTDKVVPADTVTKFNTWLASFQCTANNTATPPNGATKSQFYFDGSDWVPLTSIQDIASDLCNAGESTPCQDIEIMFKCCDPCDPDALCQSATATFGLTDTTPPTLNWRNSAAECTERTDVGNRPFALAAYRAWKTSAVCRDLGVDLSASGGLDGNDYPEQEGTPKYGPLEACRTVVTLNLSCTDECYNFRARALDFVVTDTTPPRFTQDPTNETAPCSGTDALPEDWSITFGGAQVADACGDVVLTKVITESSGACPKVWTMVVTATDECGLTSTRTATYTYTDDQDPTIAPGAGNEVPATTSCPSTESFVTCDVSSSNCPCAQSIDNECTAGPIELDVGNFNLWLASNGGLVCNDDCGEGTFGEPFIFSDTRDSAGCEREVIARFTCTDGCGNAATAWSRFVITDTMPPEQTETIEPSTTESCELDRDDDGQRLAWVRKYSTGQFKWADDDCQKNPMCYQPQGKTVDSASSAYTGYCTTDYDPVCADGTDYINSCMAHTNGHQSYVKGVCTVTPPAPYDGASCESACADAAYAYPTNPVCYNGVQYDTSCYLFCQQVYFGYTEGACTTTPVYTTNPPITTTPYAQTTTTAPYATTTPPYTPPYTDPCGYCMGYTREVCGADGVTYSSSCQATCKGAVAYTLGGCYVPECGESTLEYGVDGFTTVNFVQVWTGQNQLQYKEYVSHADVIASYPNIVAYWAARGLPLPKCKIVDTYSFTADDGCNGQIVQQADYTVLDETPPVITAAANTVHECKAVGGERDVTDEWKEFLATHGGATCADSCQDECVWLQARYADGARPTGAPLGPINPDAEPLFSPCDYQSCDKCALVTFTASDGCGNLVETTAQFRVVDTTPPDFEVDNKAEQCMAVYPSAFFATFGAEIDADGTECNAPVSVHPPVFMQFGNPYNPPYGWTTVMPEEVFGVPPAYLSDSAWEQVEAEFSTYVSQGKIQRHNQQCPFITMATIKVTDSCGNSAEKNATHIYLDTTPPFFATPVQDLTVECDGANMLCYNAEFQAWLDNGGNGVCADECFLPISAVPSYDEAHIPEVTGSCPGVVDVTFTCTDFCGNTKTSVGRVNIVDTTPPDSVPVTNVTRECGTEDEPGKTLAEWLEDRGNSGATDTCSDVIVTGPIPSPVVWRKVGQGKCQDKDANVCWNYADQCGNDVDECGSFRVRDTKAPVVVGGFNLDWTCNSDCGNMESIAALVMNKWLSDPINGCHNATDCQEDMTWTNDYQGIPVLCGTSGTVRFTVTDACGNAKTVVKTYIFREYTPLPPPPPPTCDWCASKRAFYTLRFRWESPNNVPAVLTDSANQWTASTMSVTPGATVTFTTRADTKFATNTVIRVNGQDVTIHLSCSQPIYTGLPMVYSSGRLILEGFSTLNGINEERVCGSLSTTAAPGTECPVAADIDDLDVCTCIPSPPQSGEEVCFDSSGTKSKLRSMTFMYIGGRHVDQPQFALGKASVNSVSIDSPTATITCDSSVAFPTATVAKGGLYLADTNGGQYDTTIDCTISSSSGTQVLQIHTSCSQPLNNGDRFGALQVVCFTTVDGRTCANQGSAMGGPLCPIPGTPPSPTPEPPAPAPADCLVCSSDNKISLNSLTFKYIGGNSLTNDQEGKASVSSVSFGSPEIVSIRCNAAVFPVNDPSQLKKAKSGGSGGSGSGTATSDPVETMLGGSFMATGFPNDMTCTVQSINGGSIQSITLHTSCSKDLNVGDKFGSLQLTGFESSTTAVTENNACNIVNPGSPRCAGENIDDCYSIVTDEPAPPVVVDPYECTGCDCDICSPDGGIPTMLEFEFTGGDVYTTTQPMDGPITLFQGPGYTPSDQFISTGRESIVITPHEFHIDTSALAVGQRFRLEAGALERTVLPPAAHFLIGKTRVRIVLNCNPDYTIKLGDKWGPIRLVGYTLNRPRVATDENSITGHCAVSSASSAWAGFAGTTSSGSSGAGSGVAVAGLVAGLLLIAVMVVGVYRVKSRNQSSVLSDPGTSTTDLQRMDNLQWDTSMNPKHQDNPRDKLRPRLTNNLEDGEK